MWLPNPVYEAVPYALVVVGFALATAAYLSAVDWIQTSLLVGGSILAIGGLVLLLKRRDYRMSRSRAKYDRLD